MTQHLPSIICSLAGVLTALTAGVIDHRTGRIPNTLTLGSLLCGLLVRGLVSQGEGILAAVSGAALVAAPPLVLYIATRGNGIGGGDVKILIDPKRL